MSSSSPQALPSAALALFLHVLLQHSKKQRVIQKKTSRSSLWEQGREIKENVTFHPTFSAGQTSLLGMLALCRGALAWPHPSTTSTFLSCAISMCGVCSTGYLLVHCRGFGGAFSSLSSSHTCTRNIVRHCSPPPFPSCSWTIGKHKPQDRNFSCW